MGGGRPKRSAARGWIMTAIFQWKYRGNIGEIQRICSGNIRGWIMTAIFQWKYRGNTAEIQRNYKGVNYGCYISVEIQRKYSGKTVEIQEDELWLLYFSAAASTDVKFPPNVANQRGLSQVEQENLNFLAIILVLVILDSFFSRGFQKPIYICILV